MWMGVSSEAQKAESGEGILGEGQSPPPQQLSLGECFNICHRGPGRSWKDFFVILEAPGGFLYANLPEQSIGAYKDELGGGGSWQLGGLPQVHPSQQFKPPPFWNSEYATAGACVHVIVDGDWSAEVVVR